jgi:hypothetical protein
MANRFRLGHMARDRRSTNWALLRGPHEHEGDDRVNKSNMNLPSGIAKPNVDFGVKSSVLFCHDVVMVRTHC